MTDSAPRAEEPASGAAILFMLATGVMFAALDASAKYLVVTGISPTFVSWARFLVQLLLMLVAFRAWSSPDLFQVSNWKAHLGRGLVLGGSTIFNFLALQTLQLAETTSVAFFASMAITALAGPLLGEWAGWRRWLAVVAGFIGVLVITRPGFGNFGIGYLFSFCSMLCYALYAIMTRAMSTSESAKSMIFYSALVPSILLAPGAIMVPTLPETIIQWVVLLALGVFGGIGHWTIIKAYTLASPTSLASYPYLQIVWTVCLGYFIFGQLPDGWTVAGAAIIIGSGLYIIQREQRLRLRARTAPHSEEGSLVKKL